MCPAVAGRSPDSRFMSVVLPAPLGPSTACSLPRSSLLATPLVAINPPKRLDRSLVSSRKSPIAVASDQGAAEPAGDAREAARQEHHQQDDRPAQQQLPMRGHRREELLQRDEHEGA